MSFKPLVLAGLLAVPALPVAAAPLQLVVSILPQQYLVERIAGDRAEVLVLVRPGDNEATYSPGPATLAALDGARAWFTIGVPFEQAWQDRITRDRPRLEVVPLHAGLPLRQMEDSLGLFRDHDHGHAGQPDPHTWTDPRLAARMTAAIAATLDRKSTV